MKKYTLFLVVFSFIFSLASINVNVASAITDSSEYKIIYVSGCKAGDKYSRKTGELCIEVSPVKECLHGDLFSAVTGKPCEVAVEKSVVISGVKGPQYLDVSQEGTWEVTAYNKYGVDLSYSVYWGDESSLAKPMAADSNFRESQQSATFTHSYAQAGKYTPTFVVTSKNTMRCFQAPCPSSAGTAKTSLSVKVGEYTTSKEETLYIEPSNISISVGEETRIKAYYQPPMPPCPGPAACIQAMPDPIEITNSAVWSLSQNNIAELRHTDCLSLGGCGGTTSIKGLSSGTTKLTAKYTPAGGATLSATAKVFVDYSKYDKSAVKILKQNSRGEKVLKLQEYLNKKGYDIGKMDGIFGARVRAAVLKLQADKKLKVDGVVGPEVWSALGL